MTLEYKIEFLDYWNTSSGLSGGARADTLALKDKNGMPYVPGKTMKGLLWEAATVISGFSGDLVSPDFIGQVFGTDVVRDYSRKEGLAFFTNATLSAETVRQISPELKPFLFEEIASTALDSNGIAKDHSLRRAEFALPCTLYGQIIELPDEYKSQMIYCLQYVKRLGYNRNRGYGRCIISAL